MRPGQRYDEIIRLIDNTLGDQPKPAHNADSTRRAATAPDPQVTRRRRSQR